jgi:hypothetical protein
LTYEKEPPAAFWLNQDFEWIECCHLFVRLTGYSHGADLEEAHAVDHKIPILYVPIDSEIVQEVNKFFNEQLDENPA